MNTGRSYQKEKVEGRFDDEEDEEPKLKRRDRDDEVSGGFIREASDIRPESVDARGGSGAGASEPCKSKLIADSRLA